MEGDAFEPGPGWGSKTDFAPGVPEDDGPELLYQVLAGNVHTLKRWTDGTTARGAVDLADLAAVAGGPITREGWYDATGAYIGAELDGSL